MRVVHVVVAGMVQGVGFRWYAREVARRLGLAGWVRNRGDGSVEVAASGDEQKVEQFLVALKRGPSGSRVDDVRAMPSEELQQLDRPFAILR